MRWHPRHLLPALALLGAALLSSCADLSSAHSLPASADWVYNRTGEGDSGVAILDGPTPAQRAAEIAAEPRGDYWIGRRYHVDRLRFWGYLRRPGQSWDQARLVMMDESAARVPDRLPERNASGRSNGFDNNYEYHITGNFTGRVGYDPLSNLGLPVFRPTRFQLANERPGWLFRPGERYNLYQITLEPAGGIHNHLH